MTPAQLRAELLRLLGSHLGTYTLPNGGSIPAIYVGEPPSDWTAHGLECRISIDPTFQAIALQNREGNLAEEHRVRLVAHGGGSLAAAVRVVARRFPDCFISEIPADEGLGILSQTLITIPK